MTNLQKITQSYRRHNLLILWADTPFPLPWRTPAQPAPAQAQWQRAAAQLPPPDVPLWQLPPLPVLSLDPTARLETAFAAAGVLLRAVVTRTDVPSNAAHSLLKLAGDLPSRRAVILSRADIRKLAGNTDKRHLLTEARRVLGGQGIVPVIGAGAEFAAWWAMLQPALGNPVAFALGGAVGNIPALGADFDELSTELWQIYRQKSREEKTMTDSESLKKQLAMHHRRLNILKEQAAFFGASAPPHILLEIEDIEAKIHALESGTPAEEPPVSQVAGGITVIGDGNVIATDGSIAVGGDVTGDVRSDGAKEEKAD